MKHTKLVRASQWELEDRDEVFVAECFRLQLADNRKLTLLEKVASVTSSSCLDRSGRKNSPRGGAGFAEGREAAALVGQKRRAGGQKRRAGGVTFIRRFASLCRQNRVLVLVLTYLDSKVGG